MEKKKIEKENVEKKVRNTSKKEKETQFKWILGMMVGLIVVILLVYYIMNNINKIEYKGLAFTKEKFGEIIVYHYYYYFTDNENQLIKYNLYLRNDPRENEVPIEGKIELGKKVYISYDASINSCDKSALAADSLAKFLVNNQLSVKAGIPDRAEAESKNITYIDCNTNPDDATILIKAGNETNIIKEDNCYVISVSDCNILNAVEKFEVQTILDASVRAKIK